MAMVNFIKEEHMNVEATESPTLLELRDITKRFGGITALNQVEFVIRRGEIHTLIGENGAGKSTLLNILAGAMQRDAGEIYFNGEPVHYHNVIEAKKLGIALVHQEIHVAPDMTVYENIFMGNEIRHPKTKVMWFKKMEAESEAILSELNADFAASRVVGTLSIAQRQLVEIAKAMLNEFSVIILDEPTSSLTSKEIDKLFEIMRGIAQQDKAVVFVSHRFDEVFEISDRVTVFRDGRYMASHAIQDTTRNELIELMTGRDLSKATKNEAGYDEDVVMSVRGLTGANGRFEDVSFDLHRGEILGFAGLVGAGRTETMRALFGADRIVSGEIKIDGKPVSIKNPRDAMKYGMGLVPEDRKGHGFVRGLSNMNNVSLSSLDRLRMGFILLDAVVRSNAEKFMKQVNVRPADPGLKTENLSGGNQQKVVLAKWLSVGAKILVMDEPTRGIDVGAKDEVYRLMLGLISEGVSIIMVSSELPEILNISHRIIVMREGRVMGELSREEATETKILEYAYGQKSGGEAIGNNA